MNALLFVLICSLIVSALATAPHDEARIRAKRYEYNVAVPYSAVRIQGYNPIIEFLRQLGRLTDIGRPMSG
ncbi:hypothetical protein L596_018639 [Steinernema carpocapsae]|uniref:Uncharacterized protein n=1 Tax=Steinernema carpocapsae TaxID=34508 RepID=A0A4U5N5G9_STECR|nr:hypothetical protein L596_018639 [Steinernema carpocapsae]